MDNKDTGQRIRKARKQKGMTQKELGAAISRTESSIAKYEQGLVDIPNNVLSSIAAALNVDFFSLANWDQATKALEDDMNAGIDARARLEAVFDRLTGEGKKLVADVAEILASHPDYSQVMEEPLTDTTPEEKPPESP